MAGGSKTEQKTELSLPDFYKPYWNQTMGAAKDLYGKGGFAPVIGMSDETGQGLQDNLDLADFLQQTLLPQANTAYSSLLNSDLVNSKELQNVIQSSTNPILEQLNRYAIPATQDTALAAGQLGSSRQGIAEGVARSDANRQMGDIASSLSYNALLQDQNNKQFATGNLGNFMSALQTPANLRTTVGGIKEGYETEAATADARNLLQYAQLVQAFNPGVNTTMTTTQQQSNFSKLAALGQLAIKGYAAFATGGASLAAEGAMGGGD